MCQIPYGPSYEKNEYCTFHGLKCLNSTLSSLAGPVSLPDVPEGLRWQDDWDSLVNGSRWFAMGHENELTQFSKRQERMSELSGLLLGRQPCVVCIAECRRVQGWHACVWLIINQRSLGSLTALFTAQDRHMGWWMGSFSRVIAHPGWLPRLNGRPG